MDCITLEFTQLDLCDDEFQELWDFFDQDDYEEKIIWPENLELPDITLFDIMKKIDSYDDFIIIVTRYIFEYMESYDFEAFLVQFSWYIPETFLSERNRFLKLFYEKECCLVGFIDERTLRKLEIALKIRHAHFSRDLNEEISLMIIGEKPGKKLDRAIGLNIPIVRIDELDNMLG